MPFEIAPKEVPLAHKLAALIEAGRAANPDAPHLRGAWKSGTGGCAMYFAGRALGIAPLAIGKSNIGTRMGIADAEWLAFSDLADRVITMNDTTDATLEQIVTALREDTLPESQFGNFISFDCGALDDFKITFIGSPSKAWADLIVKPMAESYLKKIAMPAKKVRKSAKTGATWPTPKHCYA